MRPSIVGVVLALIMLGVGAFAQAQDAPRLSGRGLEARLDGAEAAIAALPPTGDNSRILLRILVDVPISAADAAGIAGGLSGVVALATGRATIIVALAEARPVDVRDGAEVDSWAEALATIVERCSGRVAAWEVGATAARDVDEQAFFIKRSALAIKGVDRRALVLGADPRALPGSDSPLSEAVAPFLDGHAAPPGESIHGNVLRVGRRATDDAGFWDALVTSFEAGEAAATIAADEALLEGSGVRSSLRTALAAFPDDVGPTGGEPPLAFPAEARIRATELIRASDLSTRIVYRTGLDGRLPAAAMLVTFDDEPRDLEVHDPLSAEPRRLRVARKDGRHAAEVPLASRPLVLAWQRGRSADDVQESVAVEATVSPTVEEILARHFAAQAARDRKLVSYVSDLSTEMSYVLGATGQAIDVRIEGRYFFHESGIQEIENERFFVNGAPYRAKEGRAPELPLLQPESVQVLPLEVRLDKSYDYRLLGRDTREGRPAWKIGFRPLEGDRTAYAGTVWIDAQTFDRMAIDLVQTQLEAPVLTNEQRDTFGPVLADDGEHVLVRESRIHRTVSLLGGTVGVQVRLLFSNFRVNDAGFEQQLEQAHRSSNQMLKHVDEGLKYLRPTEDGGREIGETSSRKIFVVAGARYDEAYDGVIPLAGVNWLDYDLAGRGLQFNVFAAGAINTVSIADPSLLGSRVTLGVDAFIPFVRRRDRNHLPGTGIDEGEIVRSRIPKVDVELSRPVGRHGRAALTLGVAHESWSDDDDTAADFVAPASGWVASVGAEGELHRQGWDARVWVTRSERQGWEAWGRDLGGGPPPLEEGAEGYWKYGASVAKSWPLGRLMSAGFDAQWLGGSGLDRFSQHEFAAFGGGRLPGFDGSGIHFDEAALVRMSWGVDIAGLFGAEIEIGAGRTWNRQLPALLEDEFGTDSDHLGIALVGTLPGPWRTLIRFDVGMALWSSDHEEAEGNIVAQAVVLKLLGR